MVVGGRQGCNKKRYMLRGRPNAQPRHRWSSQHTQTAHERLHTSGVARAKDTGSAEATSASKSPKAGIQAQTCTSDKPHRDACHRPTEAPTTTSSRQTKPARRRQGNQVCHKQPIPNDPLEALQSATAPVHTMGCADTHRGRPNRNKHRLLSGRRAHQGQRSRKAGATARATTTQASLA